MLPFQIKICGITRHHDAVDAVRLGADAIGLNFYEKSPRFVNSQTARAIAGAIKESETKRDWPGHSGLKRPVQLVGVFVDAEIDEMLGIAERIGLGAIQLHGNEVAESVTDIRSGLVRRGIECRLIRAIRSEPLGDLHHAKPDPRLRWTAEIRRWIESGIDAVLLDAAVPGEFGGTGKTVDWPAVAAIDEDVPLILAGGLTPLNVGQAIRESQAQAIDVASGVESQPGLKDHAKMQALIGIARDAFKHP